MNEEKEKLREEILKEIEEEEKLKNCMDLIKYNLDKDGEYVFQIRNKRNFFYLFEKDELIKIISKDGFIFIFLRNPIRIFKIKNEDFI